MSIPTGSAAAPNAGAGRGMRASDAEREDTVARLHRALGGGRLDLTEADARVAAAYAARYRHDLPPLPADLPRELADTDSGPAPWTAIWTSIVWRGRTSLYGTHQTPPTPEQRRVAALLTVRALVWMFACALLGTALVA